MNGRLLFATLGTFGVALSTMVLGQTTEVPGALPPVVAPPISPTAPTVRPDDFTRPLERGLSVVNRPRAEYDPLGLHLGSFFLYSRLEGDEVYDDNVFATRNNTKDDFITVVSPSLDLRSNWTAHSLDLRAGATVGTYAKRSSENYGDYFGSADGRFDFSRTLAALANTGFQHLHIERDSPDSPGTEAHPVEFDSYSGKLGLAQHGLRIGYEADFAFRRDDYSNVGSNAGGVLNEKVRNVNTYSPSVRLSYELAPRYQAFFSAGGDFRAYDNSTGGNAAIPRRDSKGYRADIGGTIDLTGVTYVELFGGYLSQGYDDNRLGSIHGIDAGARVVWNVTQLTTLSLNGSRRAVDEDSTTLSAQGLSVNSPGYLRSVAVFAVDHELLRNVLLHFETSYENDDFVSIDRADNRYDVGIGGRYLLNRNVYLGGNFTYTKRESTGSSAIQSFSRDVFMLRLGGQL